MQPIENLGKYISICIAQSFTAEKRKQTDVRYHYRIIENEVLFTIKTQYERVKRRVIWRLLNNLPKQFGLKLCLCIPDPYRCGVPETQKCGYDVISIHTGIDANYSIDLWSIDGKVYTIRSKKGNIEKGGTRHLERLKEHGYDYVEDRGDWNKFLLAFQSAYGMTPMQMHKVVLQQYHQIEEEIKHAELP